METQEENSKKNNKKNNKKNHKKKHVALFHNATVVMSLMSWYTTYGGFKNTVFAEGQELVAGLASMAIQLILLGGVLHFASILKFIRKNKKIVVLKLIKMNISIKIKNIMQLIVVVTFIFSMTTSIMFSYISIANTIYQTDFAVNGNIKMDTFMRNTMQEMESDSEEYLDQMRTNLIGQMKENGEEIIRQSAYRRAKEYAATNSTILELVETKELISLDKRTDVIKKELLKSGNEVKYWYKAIRKDYIDNLHRNLINSENLGNSQFSAGLKNKINNINRDKYAIYAEYHNQYVFAMACYNKWIVGLRGGKEAKVQKIKEITKENLPTLEEMGSLYDFCITIREGLEKLKEIIDEVQGDGKAPENTKRLINEAKMNMDSLILETDHIIARVENMIKSSYGKDAKSFEELISIFGSSETPLEELDIARKQLLEMQGAFLLDNNDKLEEISEMIHNIERYIYVVQFSKALGSLKTKVNTNYNIVTSVDENEAKGRVIATGGAVTASGSGIEETSQMNVVVDVTPDGWTEVKKSQMTELEGLIYGHPCNLFSQEIDHSTKDNIVDKDKAKKYKVVENETDGENESYISEAERYRKAFLDTSDMEKAYDLIWGDKNLFLYKGKAILALVFAIFLDFGAFLIGLVMHFSRKKRGKK